MYHEANAAYKLTCQNAGTKFYINLASSLDSITDSRAYWRANRKLNGNSFVKSMKVNADDLGNHFQNVLAPLDWMLSLHFAMPFVKSVFRWMCDRTRSGKCTCDVKRKQSTRERIPSEFIKYSTPQLKASLVTHSTSFWNRKPYQRDFTKAIIFRILKKGDPKVTSNYRGITFQNALDKVFFPIQQYSY